MGWTVALEALTRLFKSKYFWYALAALIILLILKKQWNNLNAGLSRTFVKDKDYERDTSGSVLPVNETLAKDLASKLYTEIHSVGGWFVKDGALYGEILALNDQDLEYMANYYARYVARGARNQMYIDIDDEIYGFSSVDEDIMNRLSVLGLGN